MWREKYILSCTATKTNTLKAISVEGYKITVKEKKDLDKHNTEPQKPK